MASEVPGDGSQWKVTAEYDDGSHEVRYAETLGDALLWPLGAVKQVFSVHVWAWEKGVERQTLAAKLLADYKGASDGPEQK